MYRSKNKKKEEEAKKLKLQWGMECRMLHEKAHKKHRLCGPNSYPYMYILSKK